MRSAFSCYTPAVKVAKFMKMLNILCHLLQPLKSLQFVNKHKHT